MDKNIKTKMNDIFQIKIFYGNRSNEDFLIHNGFIPSRNPVDFMHLTLGISKNDILAGQRTLVCHRLKMPVLARFRLFLKTGEKYPFEMDPLLLGFLRIFHMNKTDLDTWSSRNDEDLSMVLTASHGTFDELDDQVVKFLSVRASLLVNSYPKDIDSRSLSVRRLLKSEKDILQSYIMS